MRIPLYTVAAFLLPAVLASSGLTAANEPTATESTAPGRPGEVEQLKSQLDDMRRLLEQMRRDHRGQQEQIARLKSEIEVLQGQAGVPKPDEPAAGKTPAADDDVARLRALAEGLAGPKKEEKPPEEVVYKSRGLSLQQLNPEISVAGDLIVYYRDQDGTRQRTDAFLRGLELNFQSYLDPFSKLKATTHVHDDGEVHLE